MEPDVFAAAISDLIMVFRWMFPWYSAWIGRQHPSLWSDWVLENLEKKLENGEIRSEDGMKDRITKRVEFFPLFLDGIGQGSSIWEGRKGEDVGFKPGEGFHFYFFD